MSEPWTELSFEAFGVAVSVLVEDPGLVAGVRELLPPGWRPMQNDQPLGHLELRGDPHVGYQVCSGAEVGGRIQNPRRAIQLLDSTLRLIVAEHAPELVFIHAGVVGVDGGVIVLPGRTFTGKTTLVEALLRAGASYYSDEYAVLDDGGRVHPYPKPLSVRPIATPRGTVPVETKVVDPGAIGARIASTAAPIALIAEARYRSGARWRPQTLPPGESALALLNHAAAAQTHPERVLAYICRAVGDLRALEGERGEANETAALLLAQLG